MLSPEEHRTLESYARIAKVRGKTHANPDFWRSEFEVFRKLLPSGKVIDVGCGSGRDAILFAESGYAYIGIDLSDDMLAGAKELVPNADCRKMDMYALEFPSRSFDGFWATASLLHNPKQNVSRVLQEIGRVVKTGGVGFLAMKEGEGERMVKGRYEGDERFFAFYAQEEFADILRKNGFEVLKQKRDLREYNPPESTDVWLCYWVKII